MTEQLASVPEESATSFTFTANPQSYRELIRSVAWPEWHIKSALSSQSGQSGSSISGCSSVSGSSTADFGAEELTKIAHRMVSDGFTHRMVKAFGDGGGQDRTLQSWFVELDVDWLLEIRGGNGLRWQLQLLLQNTSASWKRELVERWVRALTIVVISISKELAAEAASARFGKASVSAMLVFVDAFLDVPKVDNLQAVLHMYICVSGASHAMSAMHSLISSEAQSIFSEIGSSLVIEESRLVQAILTTMVEVSVRLNDGDDDSWAIGILRGGGEVHRNTRLMVDYIVLMRRTHASTHNSAQSFNTARLCCVIQYTVNYLNNLLWKKSKICSDQSLRYLFLLNNSYFVAQDGEMWSGHHQRLELTGECASYMDHYMWASWGDLLSGIQSNYFALPNSRKNTSLIAEFQSAFHKTYQAQKFWKVPDPRLRSLLRETITKNVISRYRDYLRGHPALEKQVSSGSNTPESLEEMLGELFEG